MLGVAAVVDLRPRLSRIATRPGLQPVWVGVLREGEHQTGDLSFGEGVTEAVRRDARATLARSLAFRAVRDAPSPGDDLDYRLELWLEELSGTVRERNEFNLLRLGFVRLQRGPSVGSARLRAVLRNGDGASVFETSVERRMQRDSGDPRQAALDALALAHEELALRLRDQLGSPSPFAPRDVQVRVLDGCALGAERAGALVQAASGIFERTAGVRLDPRVEPWQARCRGDDCLEAAREVRPPDEGFVLAFAPADPRWIERLGGRRRGLAVQLGEHVWLACPADAKHRISTLAHEIAHLFGAVHSDERSSIMHPVSELDGRFFDLRNAEILALTRTRPFGRALPAELSRGLQALYAREGSRGAEDAHPARDAVQAR